MSSILRFMRDAMEANDIDRDELRLSLDCGVACLGELQLVTTCPPAVLELLDRAGSAPSTVAAALRAVRAVGDAQAMPKVVPHLDAAAPDVRREAIRALATIWEGDDRILEILLKRLLQERSTPLLLVLAETLGGIGDERATEPLMNCNAHAKKGSELEKALRWAIGACIFEEESQRAGFKLILVDQKKDYGSDLALLRKKALRIRPQPEMLRDLYRQYQEHMPEERSVLCLYALRALGEEASAAEAEHLRRFGLIR